MPPLGTRHHLGVSIGIPEPHCTELQTWRERLGDPNAADIPPHVTLVPPTGHGSADLPVIERHLTEVAELFRPFRLHLRGSATFRPVSPVVFVPLVQGIAECELLEKAVRQGPLAGELAFTYHPHVTVAHELDEPSLDIAFESLAVFEAAFQVTGFSLYERSDAGVWRPLTAFTFGTRE